MSPAKRLDEYGQETDICYERGTKPLGRIIQVQGSALAPDMENRVETLRGYVRPKHDHISAKRRSNPAPWRNPKGEMKAEPPGGMIVGDRRVRQTPEEAEADKKRLECPFPLTFRPCEAGDYSFILNAWMRSYRDQMRTMRNETYYNGQQNLISELAKRRQVVVGCDGDTPEWIAGFICGVPLEDNRLVIDYVYVKQAYRDRGIARGLLAAIGWRHGQEIIVTHKRQSIEGVFPRYNASYNPYFNAIGFSDV